MKLRVYFCALSSVLILLAVHVSGNCLPSHSTTTSVVDLTPKSTKSVDVEHPIVHATQGDTSTSSIESIDSLTISSTQQMITTTTVSIITTQPYQLPGTFGDHCSDTELCTASQGLSCDEGSCKCGKAYPLWSSWDIQCVKCQPGWTFKNFRCVFIYENMTDTYDNMVEFCAEKTSNLILFYDDNDLNDCITRTFLKPGYYLQATYYPSLGYYLMPSYYVIVPYLSYWCNDLPKSPLYDCLFIETNSAGTGSCIYSAPCDQPYRPICEAETILSINGRFSLSLGLKFNLMPDPVSLIIQNSQFQSGLNSVSNSNSTSKPFKFFEFWSNINDRAAKAKSTYKVSDKK